MKAQLHREAHEVEHSPIFLEARRALTPGDASNTPNPEDYMVSQTPLWWRVATQPLDAVRPSDVSPKDWRNYLEFCGGFQASARHHQDSENKRLIETCTAQPFDVLLFQRDTSAIYETFSVHHGECTNPTGGAHTPVAADEGESDHHAARCCCIASPDFWFWEGFNDAHGGDDTDRMIELLDNTSSVQVILVAAPYESSNDPLPPYLTELLDRGQEICDVCESSVTSMINEVVEELETALAAEEEAAVHVIDAESDDAVSVGMEAENEGQPAASQDADSDAAIGELAEVAEKVEVAVGAEAAVQSSDTRKYWSDLRAKNFGCGVQVGIH